MAGQHLIPLVSDHFGFGGDLVGRATISLESVWSTHAQSEPHLWIDRKSQLVFSVVYYVPKAVVAGNAGDAAVANGGKATSFSSCPEMKMPCTLRKLGHAAMVVCSALAVAACTPTVFKGDIATFGKGVDETATAFVGLHERMLAKYKSDRMQDFADANTVIGVSDTCTGVVTEGQLPKDTRCLAQWAAYRAAPEGTRGPKPACPGASDSVRGGNFAFYDLAGLGEKEAMTCRLGVMTPDGSIDPAPFDDAEVLLTNAPKLIPALKGYAAGLVAIADAADRDALQESVGRAKEQLVKLGTRVDGLDGKTSPYISTIGPVADLVGAVLVATLEQRRYKALVEVTRGADPVVTKAAMILSNISMPMTAIELQEAGRTYLGSMPSPGNPPQGTAAWTQAYVNARKARENYLAIYATSPTSAFKAMADAHHQLTLALADPKRQYEAVASAIEDFADKARAAADAVEKARAEERKAKAAAAGDPE